MKRAADLFSESERQRINAAVQQSELHTSAEIVPVVAACSGRYDRPEDMVGLWFAVLALAVAWLLLPLPRLEPGNWAEPPPAWHLLALVVAVVVGFIVGTVLATRIGWLRRLLTPRQQMRDEVLARARAVFFDQRVHHTAGSSGVLLYISLFERMAAIIVDQSVLTALGQDKVDQLSREFTVLLRTSSPTSAICETARDIGTQLSTVLPRAVDDRNELADALVVIE